MTKHFGGEAWHLGWMNSIFGAGTVLGGVTLSVWGGFRRRITTSLTGLFVMGCGILLLGLSPASAFYVALAGMAVAGFTMPFANGPILALFQSIVTPEMQGRVFTLIGSLAAAMSPLGLAIAGPVADLLGVRAWYIVGGVACMLIASSGSSRPRSCTWKMATSTGMPATSTHPSRPHMLPM